MQKPHNNLCGFFIFEIYLNKKTTIVKEMGIIFYFRLKIGN